MPRTTLRSQQPTSASTSKDNNKQSLFLAQVKAARIPVLHAYVLL